MEALKWSDSYSVGHPDIDQQHQQLFSLFAKLQEAIDGPGPSFQMEQGFVQLCGYVKNHFRYEERLMKKHDFPELQKHKQKHNKIKDKLKNYRKEFNKATGKKKDAIIGEVAEFLQEWLQVHINGEDQKYSPYLAKPEASETTAIVQSFGKTGKITTSFVWSENFSVGNRKIDEQHKRLFAIFNGLVKSINSGDHIFGVEKVFLQLRGYVKNHFRAEESLMKKNSFPGYKEHKAKHDDICDKMQKYRKRLNKSNDQEKEDLALEVAGFFETWFKEHIKSEDQQYTPYLKD
ncbi:MAG: hemerythrin family protein [Magnetococcales bacterium]|nr:hemerythrin family protein [Magnetococcales bacterium]